MAYFGLCAILVSRSILILFCAAEQGAKDEPEYFPTSLTPRYVVNQHERDGFQCCGSLLFVIIGQVTATGKLNEIANLFACNGDKRAVQFSTSPQLRIL